MPPAQHPPRIVQAVRAEIGLQQRELDQVELRAAAADAFELAGNRFKRVDRGGEILPFECGESRATPPERADRTDNDPGARARRSGVSAASSAASSPATAWASAMCMSENARPARGNAFVREVVHHAPCVGIARMPGELPAPQKRNRIVQLPARRPTMDIGREGFPEQPVRRRCIPGLEVAEREMPTQVAI